MSGMTNSKSMRKLSISAKKIAIDSNIFIYYFSGHTQFGPPAKLVFHILKKHLGVTSSITFTELLSFESDKIIRKDLEEAFFSIPNLTVLDLTIEIARETARIRREYGFRLADSIQLATALSFKADVFVTNDQRLKKFKELKIKLLK